MIKYSKFFITFLLAVIAVGAKSQSTATSSSPYSRYGLGDLTPSLLPQNLAMGGIATATNQINGYSNINSLNPASYGYIRLTTIDVGVYSNTLTVNQTGHPSQTDANFRLSHLAFAIPVTHASALSFGLLPYSQLGYNYKQNLPKGFGTSPSGAGGPKVDTNSTNYLYQGEGGLSKAYFGYGITIFKHLSLGANVSYIFGDLKQYQSTEIPGLYGTLNSKIEQDNSIGGLNYDYGAQYAFDLSPTKHLTLGYSASAQSKLNSQSTYIVSQYTLDGNGVANVAADSLINQQNAKTKIQLPQINHFGISYQEDGKFLVGADYTMGKWSNLTIGGVNQSLVDSKTLNVGGQYTPNLNAIGSYWSTVDYRLGAIFDQSYLNVPNPTGNGFTNIKSYALTFGLGLPLRSTFTTTFYKINFSAEIGQRGTVANGLVKENYVNLHLGFMLNDRWFQKYKFD
ncbi:MAG TPA: hypothetical protein VGC01_02620 [Mucilaginibacter sp.]